MLILIGVQDSGRQTFNIGLTAQDLLDIIRKGHRSKEITVPHPLPAPGATLVVSLGLYSTSEGLLEHVRALNPGCNIEDLRTKKEPE